MFFLTGSQVFQLTGCKIFASIPLLNEDESISIGDLNLVWTKSFLKDLFLDFQPGWAGNIY